MNKCIFVGRTTADLELKSSAKGVAYAGFTLAVDNGYGKNKTTSFLPLISFDKIAENMATMVTKGTKILVDCEVKQDEYTDSNGNKHNDIKFKVNTFEFCEKKKETIDN